MTEDALRHYLLIAMREVPFTSMLTKSAQEGLREDLVNSMKRNGALETKEVTSDCLYCGNIIECHDGTWIHVVTSRQLCEGYGDVIAEPH